MPYSKANTLDLAIRRSLKRAITLCSLSREGIADELGKHLGRKISVFLVDAWTADTKQSIHLPADCIPALCEILQDDTIQRQLLSPKMLRDLELGESVTGINVRLKQKAAKQGRKA